MSEESQEFDAQIAKKNEEIREEKKCHDDKYEYCPICNLTWDTHIHSNDECDINILVERQKPNFYVDNIDNYKEKFLHEIIIWQDLKIRSLIDKDSIQAYEVGLKYFKKDLKEFPGLEEDEI